MNPINSICLSIDGDKETRIGPENKRRDKSSDIHAIEQIITPLSPLAITCDVKQVHPPYFFEFCYMDTLGGITMHTLSAEITCRMAEKASKRPAIGAFPIHETHDKYELKTPAKSYRKVAFLAGGNSVNTLDQSALQRVMADDEWVIKIHPVTSPDVIRSLGNTFGYHRLIGPEESGMSLLLAADEVAAMQTSELYIVARYLGKPVTDLTRYDRAWISSYHHIIRLFDDTDSDKDLIDRVLTSELSGHLRHEYGHEKNSMLAKAYFAAAMDEREKFRMKTSQTLAVEDKTNVDWQ